ncbi:MAG TPA: hypothetical protein VGK02_02760 [Candidatus Aquicultor sp.]|jgi:hypothetical protein
MLISTIILTNGEERQFLAESITIGEPLESLVRVDLIDRGEIIYPLYTIQSIHTQDLPEDAISPEVFGAPHT